MSAAEGMRPRLSGWKARLLVLGLGLLPFAVLEIALWSIGYESHAYFENSVGEVQVFQEADDQIEIRPERRQQFRTAPFMARKAAGTLRIVTVGDSVTAGFMRTADEIGYTFVEQSYPEVLEAELRSRFPGRRFEVINCGGSGFGSHQLTGVVDEILEYEPDLVTIMLGSNEFLEARHFKNWEGVNAALARRGVLHWKTLALARDMLRRAGTSGERVEATDAPPDGFSPSLPWATQDLLRNVDEVMAINDHAAHNFTRMVRACKAAGVRVLLCTAPSNLRSASFGEDVDRDTDYGRLYHSARARLAGGDADGALDLLVAALPRVRQNYLHGGPLHYLAAEAYAATRDQSRAYGCYVRAKDLDPEVIRTQSSFNARVAQVARDEGVPLLDVVKACREAVSDGIPDSRLFVDNCHFRPEAHAHIGGVFADAVSRELRLSE